MRRRVQWGEDWLSLAGAAQGCWRRFCETKHDASEAEGPSSKAKEKKGRVTPGGGGGGGRLRIRWFALNQTKSKFLRVSLRCNRVNGMEISEAATVRTRTDISILSAFLQVSHHIRTRWPCLHYACRIKGDVSSDKLALLCADGWIGRVSAGLEHTKRGP